VELDSEEAEFQLVTNKPKPDFWDLAAFALDNAGINRIKRLRAARDLAAPAAASAGPALVEANDNKIIYKITFDLPDAGVGGPVVPLDFPLPPAADGAIYNMADATVDLLTDTAVTAMASTPRQYPSRSHRSVFRH
jgi:hypothetical protein